MKEFIQENKKVFLAIVLAITAGVASFNGCNVDEATDSAETLFESVVEEGTQ